MPNNIKLPKGTTKLPHEQAVYVPSTSGITDQKVISKKQMSSRVNNVRTYLSKKYGGYTSTKAVGGYVIDSSGKLVKERIVKVTSFSKDKDFKRYNPQTINQVGKWGKEWKQDSVGYEHEGDLFYIPPTKSGRVKIMNKIVPKRVAVSPTRKRKMSPTKRRTMMANLAKARSMKRRK